MWTLTFLKQLPCGRAVNNFILLRPHLVHAKDKKMSGFLREQS